MNVAGSPGALTRQRLLKNTLWTRQGYPDISAVAGGSITPAGDLRIFWPSRRRCRRVFPSVLAFFTDDEIIARLLQIEPPLDLSGLTLRVPV
jgi:hypothetical protein